MSSVVFRNPLSLLVAAALWIATVGNWPLWRAVLALPEFAGAGGVMFALVFAGMVAALTVGLLALVAWPRMLKPVLTMALLASAAGAHFMGMYGVVIDSSMMINVLQTDIRETRDLINLWLLLSLVVIGVIPAALVWRIRLGVRGWGRQWLLNVGAAVLALLMVGALFFVVSADFSAAMRNHKNLRFMINPWNSVYATAMVVRESQARPKGPPVPIGLDARVMPRSDGTKPPLMVLMVGETARADHFELNGYARATNPRLSARPDVLSFRRVMSCGTSTAASLPCMFSPLGRDGYEARDHDTENLLDVLARAGLAVLWLDNQAGCKGVCDRVSAADAHTTPMGAPAIPEGLCRGEECFDEVMLHGLDARVAALPAAARAKGVVLVLHQMGSHGPAYHLRTPEAHKPFQPECLTNALQQCPPQALINTFDNTIAYTDAVVAQTIDWLKQQSSRYDTALLYVSDHGESLGEKGIYLHGLPYAIAPDAQKHVPLITWVSSARSAALGLDLGCLRQRLDEPLSHDNLFHSVLTLAGVRSAEYREAQDFLAPCRH